MHLLGNNNHFVDILVDCWWHRNHVSFSITNHSLSTLNTVGIWQITERYFFISLFAVTRVNLNIRIENTSSHFLQVFWMFVCDFSDLVSPSWSISSFRLVVVQRWNWCISYVGTLHNSLRYLLGDTFVHHKIVNIFANVFKAFPDWLINLFELLIR